MKRMLLIPMLFLVGCGSTPEAYFTKDYALGDTRSSLTGAVMVTWEEGKKEPGKGPVVDGRRRELVYNGLSDSTVFVAFREYAVKGLPAAGVYAAPSFANELKYSLRGNRMIVYQELRFRVEEVSPEAIRFTVVGDFKEPTPPASEASPKKTATPPESFPP